MSLASEVQTSNDVRTALQRLGWSAATLAREMGLGKNGARTVERWLSGAIPITPRTAAHIRLLLKVQELEGNKCHAT